LIDAIRSGLARPGVWFFLGPFVKENLGFWGFLKSKFYLKKDFFPKFFKIKFKLFDALFRRNFNQANVGSSKNLGRGQLSEKCLRQV